MKCANCGHEIINPTAQAGGRVGGKARVKKGFASARVLKKALATRKRNQAERDCVKMSRAEYVKRKVES
jgi:hypothetical protein